MKIDTIADLKAQLRKGPHENGSPVFFITGDGSALSYEAVKENLLLIFHAMKFGYQRDWRVMGCEVNREDENLYCSHTGKKIPSAIEAEWLKLFDGEDGVND